MDVHISRSRPFAPVVGLVAAWLLAGSLAGLRLHLDGGVFGERLALSTSLRASLGHAAPWLLAVWVAVTAARRWPLRGEQRLRDLTMHAAVALSVVVLLHLLVAVLRASVLPAAVTPVDPWAQFPLDLIRQGPVTLGVYGMLVVAAFVWRSSEGSGSSEGSESSEGSGSSPRSSAEGRIEALWLKRARRGPMDSCDEVRFEAGKGIVGNADQGGRRQVTVISAEVFEQLARDFGGQVEPGMRRANVMVRGIDLAASRGRLLALGEARLRIGGETRPCERMDETVSGLTQALDPDWRGGVYAQVESSGTVAIGDTVRWLDDA